MWKDSCQLHRSKTSEPSHARHNEEPSLTHIQAFGPDKVIPPHVLANAKVDHIPPLASVPLGTSNIVKGPRNHHSPQSRLPRLRPLRQRYRRRPSRRRHLVCTISHRPRRCWIRWADRIRAYWYALSFPFSICTQS